MAINPNKPGYTRDSKYSKKYRRPGIYPEAARTYEHKALYNNIIEQYPYYSEFEGRKYPLPSKAVRDAYRVFMQQSEFKKPYKSSGYGPMEDGADPPPGLGSDTSGWDNPARLNINEPIIPGTLPTTTTTTVFDANSFSKWCGGVEVEIFIFTTEPTYLLTLTGTYPVGTYIKSTPAGASGLTVAVPGMNSFSAILFVPVGYSGFITIECSMQSAGGVVGDSNINLYQLPLPCYKKYVHLRLSTVQRNGVTPFDSGTVYYMIWDLTEDKLADDIPDGLGGFVSMPTTDVTDFNYWLGLSGTLSVAAVNTYFPDSYSCNSGDGEVNCKALLSCTLSGTGLLNDVFNHCTFHDHPPGSGCGGTIFDGGTVQLFSEGFFFATCTSGGVRFADVYPVNDSPSDGCGLSSGTFTLSAPKDHLYIYTSGITPAPSDHCVVLSTALAVKLTSALSGVTFAGQFSRMKKECTASRDIVCEALGGAVATDLAIEDGTLYHEELDLWFPLDGGSNIDMIGDAGNTHTYSYRSDTGGTINIDKVKVNNSFATSLAFQSDDWSDGKSTRFALYNVTNHIEVFSGPTTAIQPEYYFNYPGSGGSLDFNIAAASGFEDDVDLLTDNPVDTPLKPLLSQKCEEMFYLSVASMTPRYRTNGPTANLYETMRIDTTWVGTFYESIIL